MESGLLLFVRERSPFALESGSDTVQVKVVTSVVQRGRLAVHIAPVSTGLRLLIECRCVRAEEPKVLDAHTGYLDAHVKHLALRLGVCIVAAQDLVATCEPSGGHIVQTISGVFERGRQRYGHSSWGRERRGKETINSINHCTVHRDLFFVNNQI